MDVHLGGADQGRGEGGMMGEGVRAGGEGGGRRRCWLGRNGRACRPTQLHTLNEVWMRVLLPAPSATPTIWITTL